MEGNIVLSAVQSALSLLNSEVGSIEYEELRQEYLIVIEKLENALSELTKNE